MRANTKELHKWIRYIIYIVKMVDENDVIPWPLNERTAILIVSTHSARSLSYARTWTASTITCMHCIGRTARSIRRARKRQSQAAGSGRWGMKRKEPRRRWWLLLSFASIYHAIRPFIIINSAYCMRICGPRERPFFIGRPRSVQRTRWRVSGAQQPAE